MRTATTGQLLARAAIGGVVATGSAALAVSVGLWLTGAADRAPRPATETPEVAAPTGAPSMAPSMALSWEADRLDIAAVDLAPPDRDAVLLALGADPGPDLVGSGNVPPLAAPTTATQAIPLLVRTLPAGAAVLADDGWTLVLQAPDAETADAVTARLATTTGVEAVDIEIVAGDDADFSLDWDLESRWGESRWGEGVAGLRLAEALSGFRVEGVRLDPTVATPPGLADLLLAVDALVDRGDLVAGSLSIDGDRWQLDARAPDPAALERAEQAMVALGADVTLDLTDAAALALAFDGGLGVGVDFVEGTPELSTAGRRLVDQVADRLRARPDAVIVVTVFTDDRGSAAANLDFTQRQADAVVDALIDAGIAADRLVARGAGEAGPIADNATPEGRAVNRRVEFSVG